MGALASGIVGILLKHPSTSKLMHEVLTAALKRACSWANAKKVSFAIVETKGFTQEQLDRIKEACAKNNEVKGSFGTPERIGRYLAQFQLKVKTKK